MDMTQFPPILDGKDYFHITDEIRPKELVSTNKSSIWFHGNKKEGGGPNCINMAISYNGGQVFLYLYCKICKHWRMPEEGGHTGSHHDNFRREEICLPVNHCSWIIYFQICTFYGIPLALHPTNWAKPNRVNAPIPRMIEYPQELAVAQVNNDPPPAAAMVRGRDVPSEVGHVDNTPPPVVARARGRNVPLEGGNVDDTPPPAVARARGRDVILEVGQVDNVLSGDHNHHNVDRPVIQVAIRPRRSTAGNINYDINLPSLNLDDIIGVESPICPRQGKNKKRSRHA